MSDDREERIRNHAYRLWESQGRPHGRHDEHWRDAAASVDGEVDTGPAPEQPNGSDETSVTEVETDASGVETADVTTPGEPTPAEEPAARSAPPEVAVQLLAPEPSAEKAKRVPPAKTPRPRKTRG